MSTTQNSAYLPSVYQNAYRYDDILANAIVYKSSQSTFGSISAPESVEKPLMLQIGENSDKSGLEYKWVDPASASLGELSNEGVIVSGENNTIYDVEGMNNSNYWGVALKYTADNKYVAQPLTSIAGLTAAASGNYYLSYTASDSTWASVALPTNTSVVKGGSFVDAVASNLFSIDDLSDNSNYLLVMTTSGYSAVSVPDSAGEYVISVDSKKKIVLAAATPDATGGNFVAATALSDFTNVAKYNADDATSDTTIFNAITVPAGYNYMLNINMDVYVSDITQLVSSDSNTTAQQLIASLPEIVIRVGTTELGRYTVKTNQPLQTISVSKVVSATNIGTNVITASVEYKGIPETTDGFIQIAKKNMLFGTYQSCGPSA